MHKELNQTALRRVLNDRFEQRRFKNPAYSIRAFSQRLGVSHSALSEILGGKRKVGVKLGERLADALLLGPDERQALFKAADESNRAQLQADHYRVISDWHHFAILSLAETSDFHSDSEWIAKRLGISGKQAADAVERLLRLKLLARDGERLMPTGEGYASPDGVASVAIRKTHHQYLEMAQAALERDQIDVRDFTAVTMAIDPAKLPEAKRRIRKFRDELCAFLESGEKREVFELCLQLFPLSKGV